MIALISALSFGPAYGVPVSDLQDPGGVFQNGDFRFQTGDRPSARLSICDLASQKELLLWPERKVPFRVQLEDGRTIKFGWLGWRGAPPPGPHDQVFQGYGSSSFVATWQAMRYPGKDYVQIVLSLETLRDDHGKLPVIKRVDLLDVDAVGVVRHDLPASPFVSNEFFFVAEQPHTHFEMTKGHFVLWSPYQKPRKSIPRGFLKSDVDRDLDYSRHRSIYSVIVGVSKEDQLRTTLRSYTSSRYAPGVYYLRD